MAMFGNRDIDPEQLIGMKPEELKAKLEGSVSKTDLTAALEEQSKGFASGLAEMKAMIAGLTTRPPDDAPPPDPTDPTTKVLLNPEQFVNDQTKGIREQQMRTNAALEEMRARQDPTLSGAFSKFGKELSDMANQFPVEQRAQASFWPGFVRTFVGNKVLSGKIDRDSYPSLIGSSSVGTDLPGEQGDPNRGFDPVVADWLKGRSIPLLKAERIRNIMQRDGEPISLANYKIPEKSGNA